MSKSKIYPEYKGNNINWHKARMENEPRALLEYLNHVRALANQADEKAAYQAADDEVQGIITGNKDIDRSPVRPAHPVPEEQFNPIKPNMQWNELVAADDEVKQLLSGRQSGGCTDRQKGIAAQIRTFTHGDLREELNNIVHSGDSISAKSHHPSNPYIDLSNSFDSKVEDVLNRAIKFIKENEHISYKNKKKILNGISQFNTMTNANATTFNNKSTTSLSSQVTPKKTFKDAMTANRMTTNAPIRRSRRSRRGRSRRSRRGRSRRSRRSRS